MLRLLLAILALAASPAFAAEEPSSGEKAPFEQMIQFMRTESNRPIVWLVVFKITATRAEDMNRIHIAMPRVVDEVIVKLTGAEVATRRPDIAEIKQTVMESITSFVGQIEGLDVTVQKLGRV